MKSRVTNLLALMGMPILLLVASSPAGLEEVPDDDTVDAQEMLGAILSLPVIWHACEEDNSQRHPSVNLETLREMFGLEECPGSNDNSELHAVSIAAIQGLYEQIQQRDKLMLQLDEQNRELARRIATSDSQRREEQATIARLETRLNDAIARLDREVGATGVTGTDQQGSQLARRLGSIETERRGEQARLSRIESRLDTSLSSIEGRTRDLQSRMSRLESRMMTMPRN